MWFLLLVNLCTRLAVAGAGLDAGAPAISIDRATVTVGGPITIVLDNLGRRADSCTLRVDDSDAVKRSGRVGSTLRVQERTVVLLSHRLFLGEKGVRIIKGEPGAMRVLPVFAEPGTVRLTVECDGLAPSTFLVKVMPAERQLQPSLDLLYPQRTNDHPPPLMSGQAIRLLKDEMLGVTPTLAPGELDEFRKVARILSTHPEWSDICKMRLAALEFRLYNRELNEVLDGTPKGANPFPKLPAVPEIVTLILEAKLSSAFAQAIQSQIRSRLDGANRLIRLHRGEPINEVFKPGE